jgi:hypothetical protein
MVARKQQDGAAAEGAASAQEDGLDRLTVEDVLKALEEDGIRDLQQLVKRQLAQAKAGRKALCRADMLGPSPKPASRARGKAQRPVTVPVQIDGVLYDPKDIHRFDGQVLHFVAPSDTRPLQAFTGEQWPTTLRTYIQVSNAGSNLHGNDAQVSLGGPPGVPKAGGTTPPQGGGVVIYPVTQAEFFSDSNFQGDHLWLTWQWERPDLTKLGRGDWWDRKSWNDCISSVSPVPNVGFLVLCEDINLGGASLSVPFAVRDLGPLGWNDRASSLVYW